MLAWCQGTVVQFQKMLLSAAQVSDCCATGSFLQHDPKVYRLQRYTGMECLPDARTVQSRCRNAAVHCKVSNCCTISSFPHFDHKPGIQAWLTPQAWFSSLVNTTSLVNSTSLVNTTSLVYSLQLCTGMECLPDARTVPSLLKHKV